MTIKQAIEALEEFRSLQPRFTHIDIAISFLLSLPGPATEGGT